MALIATLETEPRFGLGYLSLVEMKRGIAVHTYPFDPHGMASGIILDFNEAKQLIGVEIDGTKRLLPTSVLSPNLHKRSELAPDLELVRPDVPIRVAVSKEYDYAHSEVVLLQFEHDLGARHAHSCRGSGIARWIVVQLDDSGHLTAIEVLDGSRRLPATVMEHATPITHESPAR